LAQQLRRAETGILPNGQSTNLRTGRPLRRSDASRFRSSTIQRDVIEAAQAKFNQIQNPRPFERVEVDFDRVVGEGFRKGGGPLIQTNNATVFFDNGKLLSAFPDITR